MILGLILSISPLYFYSHLSSNSTNFPTLNRDTIVSHSNVTPSPIVTSKITNPETTPIKVRTDIYSSINSTINSDNSGFEEMIKTIATNVIDTSMSGVSSQAPQVRYYGNLVSFTLWFNAILVIDLWSKPR